MVLPGWQRIDIDLAELTQLKTTGDSISGNYALRGRPSLTNIRQFTIGLENTGNDILNSETWVDELRLTNVRKDRGTASRVRSDAQFADLLTFNANFYRKNSDFHGLLQKKGQGFTSSTYGINTTLSLQKLFPRSWGLSLPLIAGFTQDKQVPKYPVGSDVILRGEESERERTLGKNLNVTFSYSKTSPSLNRLAHLFLDPIRGSITQNQHSGDSPQAADTTKNLLGSFTYSYNPQIRPLALPGRIKLGYFPTGISFGSSYSRSSTRTYTKFDGISTPQTTKFLRTASGNLGLSLRPLNSVTGSYALAVDRDLNRPAESSLSRRFALGQEKQRSQNASLRFTPTLGTWISPSFSYATQYGETRYRQLLLQGAGDSLDLRNVSNINSSEVRATLSFSKIVGLVTHLRNEQRDSLAIVGSPQWMLIQLEKLSNSLLALQGTYRQDRNTVFYGLRERPSRAYQLGLSNQVGPRERVSTIDNDTRKLGNSYGLSSGISVGSVQLRTGYQRSDNQVTTGQNTTITRTRNWPDLNLSLSSLEDLALLKRLASSSNLSVRYSARNDETETSGMGLTSNGSTREVVPSWRVDWKKGFSSTLESNLTRSSRRTSSGSRPRTVTERKGVKVSTTYSFSAPTGIHFPFLKSKVHFNSDLDLSADLALNSDYVYTIQEASLDQIPVVTTNSNTFSFLPRASYNFSRSVTGGLEGEFTQENLKKEGRTRRRIGLNAWALFTF